MKKTIVILLVTFLMYFGANAMAEEQEADKNVVVGNTSRVGAPWNWRPLVSMPSVKTRFAVGGYVKLDTLYDSDYLLGDATNPLEAGGTETEGNLRMTSFETRLNVRTETDTDMGVVKTYVEGHFYQTDFSYPSGSNAPAVRQDGAFGIRHAYGEFRNFLFGHTWSNYTSFIGNPEILKLGGPHGNPWQRHSQIRYTSQKVPGMLAVSVEEPETLVAPGSGTAVTKFPDLVVRYEYKRNFSASAIIRNLEVEDNDSVIGYGLHLEGSLPIIAGKTTLKAAANYGEGIGRYMGPPAANSVYYPDVYVDAGGDLESVGLYSYSLGLLQAVSPKVSAAIIYAQTVQDDELENVWTGAFPKEVTYVTANVLYNPVKIICLGIEYQYMTRKNAASGSQKEDANRVQFSAIFHF
ncbi:MAG: porin [Proteobacteria bacterium]|nr:porin [Pseudomonadota bacterium]